MNVKHLRKQLMAAIAMVVVAGVALSSATYAWFVSNNSVTATTTKISAQSNSAYLVIENVGTAEAPKTATSTTSTSSTTATETFSDTKLYPAQWSNTVDSNTWQFESAYASDKDAATEKSGTRFAVGDPDTAASKDYTLANTFYIGTGTYDGTFTNLKVTGVTVNNDTSSQLEDAMRVLVTCGSEWTVWSKAGIESGSHQTDSSADGIIKESGITKGTDATVKVYVYYDGADSEVYTTNLENLKECGVTVTFEATPTEFK